MGAIGDTAMLFAQACDTGQGWSVCSDFCHSGATFSCQCDELANVDTLEGYCAWMQDLLTWLPDGHCELRSFGIDEHRNFVNMFSIFRGTHTGQGAPVPPTGRHVVADFVYAIQFSEGKIRHLTKIWNADWTLRELGWD